MKKVTILVVCVLLAVIMFFLGAISGILLCERDISIETSYLSQTINAIYNYYQKNAEYPTMPEFYIDESNCKLPLESVNKREVVLYCGLGGAQNYHIEFTKDGNVIVSRR